MDSKKKLQISVVIAAMSLLLVLSLVAGILLMPSSTTVPPVSDDETTQTEPVVVKKYSITGRVYDKNGNSIANTKFSISLGPTDFTTDENGFFILKNLPVGVYSLSGYDEEGNRIGSTVCQLSSDGSFTIGSYTFGNGEIITLCFDGDKFFAVIVKTDDSGNSNQDNTSDNSNNDNSNNDNSIGNTDGNQGKDENSDSNDEIIPAVDDDEYLTNLSWLRDVEFSFGGYGLNPYRDPDMFYDVLNDEQYDFFNTYFLQGNLEYMVKQAKDLAAKGKKMWLGLNDLISVDGKDPATNLRGDWRQAIDEYATAIYEVAGENLEGFYFDEPSYHWTSMDFTRVTKYIRETYKRRVFAVHCKAAYLTPYEKGMDIIGYKMARSDLMVINADNHKYVTDIGWWRYGSLERMPGLASTIDQYTKACSIINPDIRKWYVPVAGTYDWLSTEEETLEINYEMWRYNSTLSNFGGIMMYTFIPGTLSGRPGEVNPTDSRLTDADFVKDDNNNYVYKTRSKEWIYMSADGKYYYNDYDGNPAYMILEKDKNKIVEKFYHITEDGESIPFPEDTEEKHKLSRVVHLQTNNTIVGVYQDKYGIYDRDYEGCAAFFYLYPTADDGGYRWKRMREYLFILGNGMQSIYKGEKTFDDITAELEAVFKPDVTKYRDYQQNEKKGIDHSVQWYSVKY